MATHYFDSEFAREVGIAAAVIYNYLVYWCDQNRQLGINEYDGYFWTYHSVRDLQETFNYMSAGQIRRSINLLVEKGLVKVGNYNKIGIDRTKWYAVVNTDLSKMTNGLSNSVNGLTVSANGLTKTTNTFVENDKPIPLNTTLNTHHLIHKEVSKKDSESFDSILDSYELIILHPDLKEIFLEFIKMRKAKKKPLTNKALKLGVNKAIKLGNSDPDTVKRIVEETIEHCWDSFYPLKEEKKAAAKKSDNPFEDMMREEGYL